MKHWALGLALLTLWPLKAGAGIAEGGFWGGVFDGSKARPDLDAVPPPSAPGAFGISDPRVGLLLSAEESNRKVPVWPGYQVLGQPVLLYEDGKRSFLLGHRDPPPGYDAVLASPQTVFKKEGAIPDLQFSFQFHRSVNAVDTFAYRYETGSNPEGDAHTIVHERFHVHQETGFTRVRGQRRQSESDAEDLALAGLEQAALKGALEADEPLESSHLARQFLAIRAERYRRQPDSRAQEDSEERTEGMAEYVEQSLMNRPGVAPTSSGVSGQIAGRLSRFPGVDDMEKGRYYGTGAAQGLLLDRGGPKDWKERVSAGAAVRDVLALTYPVPAADEAALLKEAKSSLGYAALLRQGSAEATQFQRLKAKAIADYAGLPGREWTVAIPWTPHMDFGHSSGKPEFKLNDQETLMPLLMTVDVRDEGFVLHAEDRPAVIGPNVRLHASLSAAITLDGKHVALADGSYPFESLTVAEAGLELSISKPGTLTLAGRKAVLSWR